MRQEKTKWPWKCDAVVLALKVEGGFTNQGTQL